MAELPTGTPTFLLTDIEGSTHLWEEHPEQMEAALTRHASLAASIIRKHGGTLVKSRGEGDSLFAVFPSAADAVAAACVLQQAFHSEPWPHETPLRVRMALHTGEAALRDGDYFGTTVNRCARLRAAARGGQVLLSRATQELVRDSVPEGTRLKDLGLHHLRDLAQPERIYQLQHPSLPPVEAPLRSLQAFSHNLPVQVTSFVGREQEMADVKRLLASTRLLTLTGAGGTGKTRLSLQVAADLVESYEEGVWLVELATLSESALVLQAVATVLGIKEEPGKPLTQSLIEYLKPRQVLLLLDNCEHLLSGCSALAQAILQGCPEVRILATSREGLNIHGETTYRLPSLSVPGPERLPTVETLIHYEAVRLFIDRAAAAQPSFVVTNQNAPVLTRICCRLDGIPLAIELAAARLKALPVERIAERLDDCFRLLTGGSRTALPRQQTLRASIHWSYDLLSEQEQTLLQRLSVFAGGWTLEAAEAVCKDEDGRMKAEEEPPPHLHPSSFILHPSDILDLLTSLVEKSLVVYEEREAGARYRLLETIRQYSRERLLPAEEAERVRNQHLLYFVRLAEDAEPHLEGPAQKEWLHRLAEEHGNLRAALDWSLAGGRIEDGLRLAGALKWFWILRFHRREGYQYLVALLSADDGSSPTPRAKALLMAAVLAFQGGIGEEEAEALCRESLTLYRQLGDQRGIARSLAYLARLVQSLRSYEEGRTLHDESVAVARQTGDTATLAHALLMRAYTTDLTREAPQARVDAQEALALCRGLGHTVGEAVACRILGWTELHEGDVARATRWFREDLTRTRMLGDLAGSMIAIHNLADAAAVQGDKLRAARLLGAIHMLEEELHIPLPQVEHPSELLLEPGEEAIRAAWAAGQALTIEQATAYALEEHALRGEAE
jgi:predicted ATPase/class 3 adenylate cyclase